MYANYHTHTPRCRHAQGTGREYAAAAVAAGLKVLGFSDHTPQFFPGEYYSHFRMRPQELDGYCAEVTALREEYAGRLDIRLGLEAEYYPALFGALCRRLRGTPVEYLILGQHALGNEYDAPYTGTPTADAALLRRYVDQCIEALGTGMFSYIAHPDIFNFQGEEAVYAREMERLCRAARDAGVPLEINLLGMEEGRCYPGERFFRLAGQVGNAAVLGCDAHAPAMLARPDLEARGRALAARCGLALLDTVPLRPL